MMNQNLQSTLQRCAAWAITRYDSWSTYAGTWILDSAKTLVHSFVTNRVDYCNSLLASVPVCQTDQLQRVLNAAARLLLRVPRFDVDLRVKTKDRLHCLSVPERMTFKLCTLVYKSLHGLASRYLAKLCNPVKGDAYRPNLRSAGKNELIVPRRKLST